MMTPGSEYISLSAYAKHDAQERYMVTLLQRNSNEPWSVSPQITSAYKHTEHAAVLREMCCCVV